MNQKTEQINKTDLVCPKCNSYNIFSVRSIKGWRCGACKRTFKEPKTPEKQNHGILYEVKSLLQKAREVKR